MKSIIPLFFCCIFLCCSLAQAETLKLDALLKNIRSQQADFIQTTRDDQGKILQKSSGKMALQRPGFFRWETLRPNRQLVVANGKRLWIYDPDLEQVIVRPLEKGMGATPALLLSDANPILEHDFFIKVEKDNTQFLLTPKNNESMFQSIRLFFLNQMIYEMQLQDHLGNTTRIQFRKIKTNVMIPHSFFYFSPPKKVDVIDETKR